MENFTVTNNLQNLQFEIELDGEKAFLEYRWHNGDLALMHTFVPDDFEGKGIAGLLAKTFGTALQFGVASLIAKNKANEQNVGDKKGGLLKRIFSRSTT